MSNQTWVEAVAAGLADGTAYTASITATTIIPAAAKATIPAGTMSIGKTYRVTARGRITTVVTTPGTLTLDLRFGSVIISAFGAMTLNVNAQTAATWDFEGLVTVRAIGQTTTANAICTGKFTSRAVVGSAAVGSGGAGVLMLPDTTPAVGTGFDSTAAQTVDMFATWSINNANSIQTHQFIVEALN